MYHTIHKLAFVRSQLSNSLDIKYMVANRAPPPVNNTREMGAGGEITGPGRDGQCRNGNETFRYGTGSVTALGIYVRIRNIISSKGINSICLGGFTYFFASSWDLIPLFIGKRRRR